MKASSSYKMSKTTKRMSANFINSQNRNDFLRLMKDAELIEIASKQKTRFKKSATEGDEA